MFKGAGFLFSEAEAEQLANQLISEHPDHFSKRDFFYVTIEVALQTARLTNRDVEPFDDRVPEDTGTWFPSDQSEVASNEDESDSDDEVAEEGLVLPKPCVKFMIITFPKTDARHGSDKTCFFLIHIRKTEQADIPYPATKVEETNYVLCWFAQYGFEEDFVKRHWATVPSTSIRNSLKTLVDRPVLSSSTVKSYQYVAKPIQPGAIVLKGGGFLLSGRDLLDVISSITGDPGFTAATLSRRGWKRQPAIHYRSICINLRDRDVPCRFLLISQPPVHGSRRNASDDADTDPSQWFFLVHVAKIRDKRSIPYLGSAHTATRRTLDWFASYGFEEEWLKMHWQTVGRYELKSGIGLEPDPLDEDLHQFFWGECVLPNHLHQVYQHLTRFHRITAMHRMIARISSQWLHRS